MQTLVAYQEQEEAASGCPERHLLAAIFERAMRDLFCFGDLGIMRDAIGWFTNIHIPGKLKFTFSRVHQILQFSKKRLDFINERVAEAKSIYDQRMQKGKACRTGSSELDEREWDCIRKKNATAQWRRRVVGHSSTR